jgi:UDP-glucose 4-epimerase
MNILILGSQGFIGTHLCNNFLLQNYNVVGVDVIETPANISYTYIKVSRLSSQWDTIFAKHKFDICINAAGSGNVAYSVENPLIDFEANTLDVIKILDAIRLYNPICKYIHISSAAVYGNPEKLPIAENDLLQPISPYGFHKQMSEIVCKEYASLYNIPIAILRPFSIYGKGLRKQLIWDLCHKMNTTDVVELFGTGNESRDFIHISDFVQAVNCIINKSDFNCSIYNLASGKEITINEVASIFEKHYQKKISFNGKTKPGDPVNWRANIDALKVIGFIPQQIFEDAIVDFINWFKLLQSNG